ncbi:MAG: 16S rRNA (uracil(1498)-N(3))-methyltransferase [Bacillota bacterium]|nr:16S rRNA (uracil(1498)-N(3))-methyltransferase [Bacillota bacterium]
MLRFFVKLENISSEKILITDEDFNHIKNVLRLRKGDSFVVCDGNCTDYNVVLEDYSPNSAIAKIIESNINTNEPDIEVTLFQGIPKSDKMDLIIQKSIELGVKRIVPVLTEHTVVKLNSEKDVNNKLTRWQRIAYEAAKQCNRGIIPQIETPVAFKDAIVLSKEYDLSLIPYEKEEGNKLKSYLVGTNAKNVSIIIGPEGGFSSNEVQFALQGDVIPVTLGPRILRTETAGFVALSIVMYELGDVG